MKAIILALVLVVSLFLFTSTAHAYTYFQAGSSSFSFPSTYGAWHNAGHFHVFSAPTLPTTFRTFSATGFNIVHSPAFVGSALHQATFGAYATSRVATVPTMWSWNGFRSW